MRGTFVRLSYPGEVNEKKLLIDSNLIRVNITQPSVLFQCNSIVVKFTVCRAFFEKEKKRKKKKKRSEHQTLNLCVQANHKFPIYAMAWKISRNRFLSFSFLMLQHFFTFIILAQLDGCWHIFSFFRYNIMFLLMHWILYQAPKRNIVVCKLWWQFYRLCTQRCKMLQETHYLIEAILIAVLAFHFATQPNEVQEFFYFFFMFVMLDNNFSWLILFAAIFLLLALKSFVWKFILIWDFLLSLFTICFSRNEFSHFLSIRNQLSLVFFRHSLLHLKSSVSFSFEPWKQVKRIRKSFASFYILLFCSFVAWGSHSSVASISFFFFCFKIAFSSTLSAMDQFQNACCIKVRITCFAYHVNNAACIFKNPPFLKHTVLFEGTCRSKKNFPWDNFSRR